jgi:hypothetical protein
MSPDDSPGKGVRPMMFEDSEVAVAIWEWFWRKGITHFVAYAPETVGLKIQDSRSRFVVADQDRHWLAN